MGLLNDYGRYGGTATAPPRSRRFMTGGFDAPQTFGGGPSFSPPATDTGGVERGIPERIKVDQMVGDTIGGEEPPLALQVLGRAPGYVLGAPVATAQAAGKAAGFDFVGLLGNIAQSIPFLPGQDDEGNWNWSLGGFLGQAGRGFTNAALGGITMVHQGINAANADAIKTAQAGSPDDPAPFNVASALLHDFSPIGGETETNAQFLARMGKLGWTSEEMAAISAGADAWSFDHLNHRLSEDVWEDLAYNIVLDPLTYAFPIGLAKGGAMAARATTAIQSTDIGRTASAVSNLMGGSQTALRARQGAGLAQRFITEGILPAAYAPVKMASQAIRSGAQGAAQHATRWSVADAILTSTRGFRAGFMLPMGAVGRPIGGMVRHATDVKGYVSGFRPNTADEVARAAELGIKGRSPFWEGMKGYASRSTALRGTQFGFEQTTEGIDAMLGDEDGDNTALGGFTENLRELGHAMLNEDPLGTNLTGMIVAGFLYPGIPIISEAAGLAKGPGVRRAASSVAGTVDSLTRRAPTATDIPSVMAFRNLFAPDVDFTKGAKQAAEADALILKRLGGMGSVREMYNAALTMLVHEHLIRGLPNEWRIRSIPHIAARAQASRGVYQRAAEYLLETGRITDRDIQHAIMAMDEGTGGFDLAKAQARSEGATRAAGASMPWDPELAAHNWVRFQAAWQPIRGVLTDVGVQVTPGIREYLPKETIQDIRSGLALMRQGKGKDAHVTVRDVQRVLRDHPQFIGLDPTGTYWQQFADLPPDAPVKWSSIGRKLKNAENRASTWDEIMADVNAHEASAGSTVTGMGPEPLRTESMALENGRIRLPRALPGEARVAVSRYNPEVAPGPSTFREARALRANPIIQAAERRIGAVLHDAGVNVQQVHQTIGGWATETGVAREPSISISMGRAATLEETRLTAAMAARQMGQQETLFWVTGGRMADMGVKPNAALGRITNIPRRAFARVEEVLHRRYGDGYTFDDTAGEVIVFVPDAEVRALIPDLEATMREANVKGTAGAEPAYVDFIGQDEMNATLAGAQNDARYTRFVERFDEAINNPDFDESRLTARVNGHANRAGLAPAGAGGRRNPGVNGTAGELDAILRDGIRRTQADDGTVIPGMEAENASMRQQLRDLHNARREALTRTQILYKASDPGDFDPLSPITAPADAAILQLADTDASLTWSEDGRVIASSDVRSFPNGSIRNGVSGAEVLREVPVDQIVWAQDVLTTERGQAMVDAPVEKLGYGRAVLINGRMVLLDGHHRLNEAMRRGEGTIKVWVGEARETTGSQPGGRSNPVETLPLDENYSTPLDDDALILDAVNAELLDVDEVLGRVVNETVTMSTADIREMAIMIDDATLRKSKTHSKRIADLAAAIQREGLQEPLEIRLGEDGKPYLAEGYHRLAALEDLGIPEAAVTRARNELTEFTIKQKYAAAEEQVLYNRVRDAEIDELFPELRYDRSTGSLSPEEMNAIRPDYHYLMKNFGGAYDLKVAPEMSFPTDQVLPAALKVNSLVGQWLREYGPVSKVNSMVDWFLAPVDTGRQARLARQAMYKQLVPRGASQSQIDRWVDEMSKMTGKFTVGPLRLKLFRDATALTPSWINEAALRVFPEKVVADVGADNFHLILDRSANRFIRDTMFPGLQGGRQGGSRGRLQRLVADAYYIFQTGDTKGRIVPASQRNQIPGLRGAAEKKRVLAKTIYPIFRFMLDPRWHLMNRFEYNILSAVRDGKWAPELKGRKGSGNTAGDPIGGQVVTTAADIEQLPKGAQRYAQVDPNNALLDVESLGGGMLHNREAAGLIGRLWQSRSIDDIEQVVNQMPEMDGALRDLMRLFPDEDTRPVYDKINDFMYEMDMRGSKQTVTDEAVKAFGADVAERLEPMLNIIADRHEQTFQAITQMLQGNPARNNLERIMNSYWLYWPISYQLKAGKWLFEVLTEGVAGKKTNFGGASMMTYLTERHLEKLATDPQYQQMMEDHEGLFLAATMMIPITPFDLGVSLNRGVRGVGGQLGFWEEYKRAQDPMTFATWMAELGPLYSIQLASQVYTETFGDRQRKAQENERSGRSTTGTPAPGFNTGTTPGSVGAPAPTFGP